MPCSPVPLWLCSALYQRHIRGYVPTRFCHGRSNMTCISQYVLTLVRPPDQPQAANAMFKVDEVHRGCMGDSISPVICSCLADSCSSRATQPFQTSLLGLPAAIQPHSGHILASLKTNQGLERGEKWGGGGSGSCASRRANLET